MGNRITTYLRLVLFLCLCAAAGLSGCEPIQAGHYHEFEDDSPTVRLTAITRAGNARDKKAIPYLVDQLADSEPDVRLFAIVALRKTTGETFGYRHYGSRRSRAEAVAKWHQWLKQREKTSTQPGQRPQAAQS
ncbi:MAG: HEAT repeat domain-containing protein [Phycisphaerae bacterium]|nr:HEAT repeat domain-containing protein [Phycisphaerae bacterium]